MQRAYLLSADGIVSVPGGKPSTRSFAFDDKVFDHPIADNQANRLRAGNVPVLGYELVDAGQHVGW